MLDVNRNACLLPAHQFTTIFDHAYKMPGLTSYILMSDRVSCLLLKFVVSVHRSIVTISSYLPNDVGKPVIVGLLVNNYSL